MKPFSLSLALAVLGGVSASAQNLIVNGDFSDNGFTYGPWPEAIYDNPGFTSGYDAVVPEQNAMYVEGAYALSANPVADNGNFLPLPSSPNPLVGGPALVVNGAVGDAAADVIVWQSQQLNVQPNTNYLFSAWLVNVNNPTSWGGDLTAWKNSQAILDFQVFEAGSWTGVNNAIIDLTDPNVDSTQWTRFERLWNSGSNQVTAVRLVNRQTAAFGNDFAMDGVTGIAVIPEPSSWLLSGLGAVAACLRRRRG